MAAISPSPDSVPSNVPPPVASTPPPPLPSTPPLLSTPPPPSTPTPVLTPPAEEPNANSSDPPIPSPPPNTPPPTNPRTPPPVSPPPVDPPPPLNSGAPPPSVPVTPPPTPIAPPPNDPPPPPPPQTPPPVLPPNPPTTAPPPPPSATPPTNSPPPSSPSPPNIPTPPSSEPPRTSPPPPPPPSTSDPPVASPPPPSSEPPKSSPSPPASSPPKRSPPSPGSEPPKSSPSPPALEPPSTSPPSTDSPPPSDSLLVPRPSGTPVIPPPNPPSSLSPPSPGSTAGVPPGSSVPNPIAPETAKGGSKGGIGSGGAVALGIIGVVVVLGLLGLVGFWFLKKKKRKPGANGGHVIPASVGSSPRSDGKLLMKSENQGSYFGGSGTDTPSDHGGFGHSRSWFTYQDLLEATGGFSDENLLGEGGFGYVYKGILADGRVVAVKHLKVGGQQGDREFKAEVEIINRIHHRHLVSLVGYCIWDSKRLLVYDYVPNNTLHFHLHGGGLPIDWSTRVKIAAGAARGIAYLHEDCHPRIIHRDIKSSNILLDNNFDAKVSDFGLAKLAIDADSHISTRVMGTFGYLAPEYATSGKLTEKSDVFSFGVVLLELLTGRKPVDESQPLGDESLVEWARPRLTHALDTGEFDDVIDPKLGKNFIESEMLRMIEAAAACVRHSATKRPRMGQVVRALDGISDSGDLSNGLRVGESQLYDSAQQSAEIRLFRRFAFGIQDISTDFFSSPSQNVGHSTNSGHNVAHSGGDTLRQQSQDSQNMGFSRPSHQNVGFTGQQGQHSGLRRAQSTQAIPSQNVDSSNQGSQSTGPIFFQRR